MQQFLKVSQVAAIAHESIRETRRQRNDFTLVSWMHVHWEVKKRTVDAVRFLLKTDNAPEKNPIRLPRHEAKLFRATVKALSSHVIPEC